MRIVALLCNIVLFGFTCLVLATDGVSGQAAYVAFTALLLLVPLFTALLLVRDGTGRAPAARPPGASLALGRAAVVGNVVLLAFAAWALVDQYPHPDEPGFVPYVITVVLTPILNLVVFLRSLAGARRVSQLT